MSPPVRNETATRHSIWNRFNAVVTWPFRQLGALAGTVTGIASLLGGLLLIFNAIPAMPGAWSRAYHTIFPDPPPSNLVVFVSSNQDFATSYLSILSGYGIQVDYVDYEDPSQLDELVNRRPGVVIVGDSSPDSPALRLSARVRQLLANNTRILGMGPIGARLFDDLRPFSPLGLRHAAGTSSTRVKLASNVPKALGTGLPSDPFPIYQIDDDSGLAIHDTGSLDVIQARRFAEASIDSPQCGGHFWSLMQQGDDYFWGYSQYATKLTADGRQLFVNLINQMLVSPIIGVQFEEPVFLPGSYVGTVGCDYAVGSYTLRVTGRGTVSVKVTSKQPLELVLSEQGLGATVRKQEEVSPVVDAQASPPGNGEDWLVTVAYRRPATTDTRVSYVLTIDYPAQPALQWPVWLVFGALVASIPLILFGFAHLQYRAKRLIDFRSLMTRFSKPSDQ